MNWLTFGPLYQYDYDDVEKNQKGTKEKAKVVLPPPVIVNLPKLRHEMMRAAVSTSTVSAETIHSYTDPITGAVVQRPR